MDTVYYALNPWWENKNFETGIQRNAYIQKIPEYLKRKQIELIIGSRRIGKTTFLKQIIKECLKQAVAPKNILYLTLDHPRISQFSISELLKDFRKEFAISRDQKLYLFLDEIQESKNWEKELKALYDLENIKFFCTGSTSSLIEKQGGKLTGRQIVTTIYPLSYPEFLQFKRESPSLSEDYQYERLLEEYLNVGGYPENVLNPSQEYLKNLLDDIIARDIMRIYSVKRAGVLKDLMMLLAGSVGSRISFNKLSKTLEVSLETVRDYIGHLESAFLVKTMGKWSASHNDRVYAQKKIYFYDTGIKTLLTGLGDAGVKMENIVFIDFLKHGQSCGYYAESQKEVDFCLGSFQNPQAVEAKYVDQFDWEDKKYDGIRAFLKKNPKSERITIISKSVETDFKNAKISILIIPAWKYFLKNVRFYENPSLPLDEGDWPKALR